MKQTIAWIGENEHTVEALTTLSRSYRLLWARGQDRSDDPVEKGIPWEVEVMDCAKESCWEADIIVFSGEVLEEGLPEKIREVATQKTVLIITWDNKSGVGEEKLAQIRKALPFSKIVEVILHPDEMRWSGEDPEAVDTAKRIAQLLGY